MCDPVTAAVVVASVAVPMIMGSGGSGGGSTGDGGAAAVAQSQADQQRAAEQARQDAITTGTKGVNDAFSQFDDPYYSGITDSYDKYYNPQLDKQYADAKRQLILNLGATNNSSEGQRQLSNLNSSYQTDRQSVADQGVTAAQTARQNVESARENVLGQLNTSADPSAAAAAASAQAATLSAPPSYSPLGNLFQNYGTLGANSILAAASVPTNQQNAPLVFAPSGGSASKIVSS